jgi:glycerate dehydrogenase
MNNATAKHDAAVRAGQWQKSEDFSFTVQPLIELGGLNLGIVGLGAIGRQVAIIGHAFGMKILAANQSSMKDVKLPGIDVNWMSHDELFAQSDVVTLHCPLTDQTKNAVNAKRLATMKPTAYLINAGRGALVDEQALADALKRNVIAGAGLDVLSVEPPSGNHVLLSAPRCVITPHIAWATQAARRRLMAIAVENLAAYLSGGKKNIVTS